MIQVTPAVLRGMAGLAAAAAFAGFSHAQVFKFQEDFEGIGDVNSGDDGPIGLIQDGWIFRNQSDPGQDYPAWIPWDFGGFPNDGSTYLTSTAVSAGFLFGAMSQWAILPPIPSMEAGDEFSLWVLGGGHIDSDTFVDIRYSPSGGTSTGSSDTDVGDFTQVLFTGELPLIPQFVYEQIRATVPGNGRIAIRFHAPFVSTFAGRNALLHIDSLTIGDPPGPPCGLDLPEPGETVVWDASGSPYTICTDLVIPVGATLEIGPGATVIFPNGNDLLVEGTVHLHGSASSPVVVQGDNVSGFQLDGGSMTAAFADINAQVWTLAGGSFEATDSIFRQDGWVSSGSAPNFMRLERCEIQAGTATFATSTFLKDVHVTNPNTHVGLRGFWNIESLDSVAPIEFSGNLQNKVVDNVTVTGVASAPALTLTANTGTVEYHLGPSNVLQGNQYPVWPRSVGLTFDSAVPTTGNINNAILGLDVARNTLRSRVSIPNLGVPYHFLERGTAIGEVKAEPGVVFKFGPTGGFTVGGDNGGDGSLRGLPGAPIRFERLDPDQEWFSLAAGPGWHLFEYLSVDGAGIGIVGNECLLWLRETVVENCAIGVSPAAEGQIYASGVVLSENDLGLRDDRVAPQAQISTGVHFNSPSRPNLFENNVIGAWNFGGTNGDHEPFPAENCWWNHPTGPFEAIFHPQGQGDEVNPFVQYEPFLTQRPDLSDTPPIVRLKTRTHPVILPGEKVFIEWDAFDDGHITHFDIQVLSDSTDINVPLLTFIDLATNLPGTQRRFELIIPDVGLHPYERFAFRIVAHDDKGQSNFEQFWFSIPHQVPAGTVNFHTQFEGLRGGEHIPFCFDYANLNTNPRFYIEAAADDRLALSAPGIISDGCTLSPIIIPYVSSDRVRLGLRAEGNFNRDEWYFTDYFTIRPDPRLGDEAPVVDMTFPNANDAFIGGSIVPIEWTASDDQGLREFRIQASFNGGYTFHTIADELPGSTRAYHWRLPASTGINDVRLRVVAVDTTFQNSSDGDDQSIIIQPGDVTPCAADLSGSSDPNDPAYGRPDGTLDIADFFYYLDQFVAGNLSIADLTGSSDPNHPAYGQPDGQLDGSDFFYYLDRFVDGCP